MPRLHERPATGCDPLTGPPDARRHILLIGHSAELYGGDRMLLETALALAGENRVTVFVAQDGPLVQELRASAMDVVVSPHDFGLRRQALQARHLPGFVRANARAVLAGVRLGRSHGVSLVYSNTQAVVIGWLVALALGRRHVWHVHEILEDRPALARVLCTMTTLLSSRTVCASDAVAAYVCRFSPVARHRVTVVRNCVGHDFLASGTPGRRGRTPRPPGTMSFACIGRLSEWKGQALLLDAYVRAGQRERSFAEGARLDFFGDCFPGYEHVRSDIERAIRAQDLSEVVRLRGFVADRQQIYDAADVVVVSSTRPEPFNLVVIEAGSRGLPVIAPDEGGPRETVIDGRTGLLYQPRDPDDLARALLAVWSSSIDLDVMGEAARAWVQRSFGSERYRREVCALVRSVIGDSLGVAA